MTDSHPAAPGAVRVHCLPVGELEVNCYLVARTDRPAPVPCVVVDPGDDAERIVALCRKLDWRPEMVLFTHGHFDHVLGAAGVLAAYPEAVLACSAETARRAASARLNLSVFMNRVEQAPAASRHLADGEAFAAAGIDFVAAEIPGHDPGELVYYVPAANLAFTGDTVFAGSVGRSDFPGGDGAALVASLRRYLSALPPETRLYPGHGPATTAGRELRSNPFL